MFMFVFAPLESWNDSKVYLVYTPPTPTPAQILRGESATFDLCRILIFDL